MINFLIFIHLKAIQFDKALNEDRSSSNSKLSSDNKSFHSPEILIFKSINDIE